MTTDPIVITSAIRTPMGSLLGELKDFTAAQLGGAAIQAALKGSQLHPQDIAEVIMGCVLMAGQGQAPARQAALSAGLLDSTPCSTINKMCGSGMQAVMLAHAMLSADIHPIMIAGGMESMSNAPYLLNKARAGYRLGHGQLIDHIFLDGLEDAYDRGKLMGVFAEATAKHFGLTRHAQDDFAITSLKRAQQATQDGTFSHEITPLTVHNKDGENVITQDEGPLKARIDKIPHLKPAFSSDGTVTAANSSSISDGAAALVLMRASQAAKLGIEPLARIVGYMSYAQEPAWFTTAPVFAIQRLLEKIKWHKDDVDLYEINEAFAAVTMVAMQEMDLPHDKVNIHGGACALGHPIGASGARILVTLLNALKKNGLKRGVASLCIGGGEATAMAIEI
ncbi:MAG: acetyl-CoA C-acyltransferase [Gammaproteobacteria bacterium]|nr:acetyl-CoA C-acyltransferase [Gammaproteobacteria bacterium]